MSRGHEGCSKGFLSDWCLFSMKPKNKNPLNCSHRLKEDSFNIITASFLYLKKLNDSRPTFSLTMVHSHRRRELLIMKFILISSRVSSDLKKTTWRRRRKSFNFSALNGIINFLLIQHFLYRSEVEWKVVHSFIEIENICFALTSQFIPPEGNETINCNIQISFGLSWRAM